MYVCFYYSSKVGGNFEVGEGAKPTKMFLSQFPVPLYCLSLQKALPWFQCLCRASTKTQPPANVTETVNWTESNSIQQEVRIVNTFLKKITIK